MEPCIFLHTHKNVLTAESLKNWFGGLEWKGGQVSQVFMKALFRQNSWRVLIIWKCGCVGRRIWRSEPPNQNSNLMRSSKRSRALTPIDKTGISQHCNHKKCHQPLPGHLCWYRTWSAYRMAPQSTSSRNWSRLKLIVSKSHNHLLHLVYDFCINIHVNTREQQMRREEAAARARLLPSTAALVCSAHDTKTLDSYSEEKSQFEAYTLSNSGAL